MLQVPPVAVGGVAVAGFHERRNAPRVDEGDEQNLPGPALGYSHPVGVEGGMPGPSHPVDMEQPTPAIYPAHHPGDPLSGVEEGIGCLAIPLGIPCVRPSPLQYPAPLPTSPAVCVDVGMQTSVSTQVSQPLPYLQTIHLQSPKGG